MTPSSPDRTGNDRADDGHDPIARSVEVFARAHAEKRSLTHPYLADRVGPLWALRDAPRTRGNSIRQYVARAGDELVGWVTSIAVDDATYCSDMLVTRTSATGRSRRCCCTAHRSRDGHSRRHQHRTG